MIFRRSIFVTIFGVERFTFLNVFQMKKFHLLIFLLSFLTLNCQSESSNEHVIEPVLINKLALSGIGLKQFEQPNDPGKEFYQKKVCWGDELGIFIVSTNSYVNKMNDFPFDEYVYMLHGEAEVRPKDGTTQRFKSREHFFAPKGYTGEWEIMAGDHLHYELSVITTKRADSTSVSNFKSHTLIDPTLLSGVDIHLDENGIYKKEIVKGAELTFTLHAEKSSDVILEKSKEMLVHVLSGMITIKSTNQNKHNFHTGDFFFIPKDMEGQWKTDGHSLVKYLTIERSW